ncbi:TPA: LysR family transcriptional regulator [Pseudomonas putida]|uniref:LysR substrate-binding domain-containing protein n=1 Tax=Pseudomonas putida TaxID=303 RepID=UPI0023646E87|nr:LysR family transcriptional regulator [Pseudomonas putida]MDD2076530.1 LysR substrate-binding domain-containing protein [Pseudomonas putida]HDS1692432.1 LysR family transcriptional regulator [Pseudomonas putida]
MNSDQLGPLLADIHLLTVLSQAASFTKTAERLGVSKASVSARVSALEKAMGLPLVRRTTRQVSLTEAAHNLVAEASPALERIDASVLAIKDLVGVPRGKLRVTAPVALGRQHLAPLIPAFLQQYPEISIELELVDRLVNLLHEGFDVAIRHTSSPPESCIAWKLRSSRSVLVASQSYLGQHGVPEHPRDLLEHNCVLYSGERATGVWTFVRERGKGRSVPVTVPVYGNFRANNSEVMREVVAGGVGVGMLPDFSVVSVQGEELVEVLPKWRVQGYFGSHLYALRPWSANVPKPVKCFVGFLREHLATRS